MMTITTTRHHLCLMFLWHAILLSSFGQAFVVTKRTTTKRSFAVLPTSRAQANHDELPPFSLSVQEIKAELHTRGVPFADCFDKESLVQRLQEARSKSNDHPVTKTTTTTTMVDTTTTDPSNTASPSTTTTTTTDNNNNNNNKPDDVWTELRAMRVKELRTELAQRNVRWAGLLEKEDLVRAVYQARQAAAAFSATGLVLPGHVAALSGDQVRAESTAVELSTPLLVDAYATWCGPCQIMAPQLAQAAAAWGNRVRVVKLDTDANAAQASLWNIQGLPTLLLFQRGKLVARVEGALMKEQIMDWVDAELAKVQSQPQPQQPQQSTS